MRNPRHYSELSEVFFLLCDIIKSGINVLVVGKSTASIL